MDSTPAPDPGTVLPVGEPWECIQFVHFQSKMPRLVAVAGEWKEDDHVEILQVKDTIGKFTNLDEWELRKKVCNPYEAIFSSSDENPFPSVTNIHALSRSYFKMVEMMKVSRFWDSVKKDVPFSSAHICEGPGGFLQCTVEQAKQKKGRLGIGKFYAMTLKPTKTQIPGWRRSIHFLKKHPQIQLEYGEDDTGDILNPANQAKFLEVAKQVQLFTADGGFDFSVDYAKQEQSVFQLLVASFSIGLGCLSVGGTMIVKLFDMYSPATKDLVLGSATCFKKFTIYKPATSRPCNSERYFIGVGYAGPVSSSQWIHHLQSIQLSQTPLTRLVDFQWNSKILEAVKEQIVWQENQQIQIIQDACNLDKNTIPARITKILQKSRAWCKEFTVPLIDQASV
jgi:cap2 methyltransferase